MKDYTPEEIAQIEKSINEDQVFMQKFLKKILKDNPQLSSPESSELILKEQDEKIETLLLLAKKDSRQAVEFYISACPEEQNYKLVAIFSKIASILDARAGVGVDKINPITTEDCEFLEELAKQKLIENEYECASCMYRFLVQINQFYSGGWVGWAICEHQQQHIEVVKNIYQIALALLPYDYYICLFAADFYIGINNKAKAKEILKKAKNQLLKDKMEKSKTFTEVNFSLNAIQTM